MMMHRMPREDDPVPFSVSRGKRLAVASSLDVDSQLRLLPFQRQSEPRLEYSMSPGWRRASASGSKSVVPAARARVSDDVAIKVLAAEIRGAEKENAVVRRHLAIRDKVIDGLCELHAANRS